MAIYPDDPEIRAQAVREISYSIYPAGREQVTVAPAKSGSFPVATAAALR